MSYDQWKDVWYFFFHFPQIKSVPKELRDVQEDFGKGLDWDVVEWMYRPLVPYVQRLAEFYFTVYQKKCVFLFL